MIVWTSIIAGGLLLSMLGIVLIFISKPPTVDLVEARKEEQKLEFSVTGVRLLLLGAAAQLVGTVGQVIILVCRG